MSCTNYWVWFPDMSMSAGMYSMDSVVLMVLMAITCDTIKYTELSYAVTIMK